MNGADNFIFEILKGMIERQEISSWHAIAFVIALTVTFPIILKIGKVFVFFKNIKDSKINRLEKCCLILTSNRMILITLKEV